MRLLFARTRQTLVHESSLGEAKPPLEERREGGRKRKGGREGRREGELRHYYKHTRYTTNFSEYCHRLCKHIYMAIHISRRNLRVQLKTPQTQKS